MYILDHPHFKIYHSDDLTLRANHIKVFNQYFELLIFWKCTIIDGSNYIEPEIYFQFKIYFFTQNIRKCSWTWLRPYFWHKNYYFSSDFDLENIFLDLKCSFSNQNIHFSSMSNHFFIKNDLIFIFRYFPSIWWCCVRPCLPSILHIAKWDHKMVSKCWSPRLIFSCRWISNCPMCQVCCRSPSRTRPS